MSTLPVILTIDNKDCSSESSLALTKAVLDLQLQLAIGMELDDNTSLNILPVLDAENQVKQNDLSAVISTDNADFVPDSKNTVHWLMADFGNERQLSFVQINNYPDTGTLPATNYKARLKLFINGNWLPMLPIDILDLNTACSFSPIMASKLLIELVEDAGYGLWKPKSDAVDIYALFLKASTTPANLAISIAGKPVDFKHQGFLSNEGVHIDGFANAVNRYLATQPTIHTVPIQLTATGDGNIRVNFKAVTVTVARELNDPVDGVLQMLWQHRENNDKAVAKAAATLDLNKARAKLLELEFSVAPKLLAHTLLFPANAEQQSQAQLLTSTFSLAQGFHGNPKTDVLTGLELKLQTRSSNLNASLALHPDQHGYPAQNPYSGAVLAIDWLTDGEPRETDGWLFLPFPSPVKIPDENFWIVLSVQQGEVLWYLADNPPVNADCCLYRKTGEAWMKRGEQQWAQTRLCVFAAKPKTLTATCIQRGEAKVSLELNAEGKFCADSKALELLNNNDSQTLRFSFQGASTGTITVRNLRVVYK
jgi:hypothetical protein